MAEEDEKPDNQEDQGVLLFTLAYNPATAQLSYQTGLPIQQVLDLIRVIQNKLQRQRVREEVLAELAKQEEEKKE